LVFFADCLPVDSFLDVILHLRFSYYTYAKAYPWTIKFEKQQLTKCCC
jgi:hypothetical protein